MMTITPLSILHRMARGAGGGFNNAIAIPARNGPSRNSVDSHHLPEEL